MSIVPELGMVPGPGLAQPGPAQARIGPGLGLHKYPSGPGLGPEGKAWIGPVRPPGPKSQRGERVGLGGDSDIVGRMP
jgi:hypothetical protein